MSAAIWRSAAPPLVACVCLAFAALDVREGAWLAVAGTLGVVLLVAALGAERPADRPKLAAINLGLLMLLLWSLQERTPIEISARGDRLQARAGGELVQARDIRYASGQITVLLEPEDMNRPARAEPAALGSAPLLRWLLAPTYQGYLGGLSDVVLRADGREIPPMQGPHWQGAEAQVWTVMAEPASEVELQAVARRLAAPFAFLVRLNPDGEGYRVLAQPETRDLSLGRVRDGRLIQELENRGSPYRVGLVAALQSVVREVLRGWLFGLIVVAGVLTVARLRIGRWRSSATAMASWISIPLTPALSQRERGRERVVAWIVASGLAVLALVVTGLISVVVFEAVPHDRDSVAYVFQGRLFAGGAAWAPAPVLPDFFKEDFIVSHDGRWFGKYAPGHPLVLALGLRLGAPWLVGPVLAALSVAALLALGRLLYPDSVGAFLAAVLLVTSPFFLFMSGSYLAHSTALLLATLALLSFALAARGSSAAAVAGGLALGALLLTRQLSGAALCLCLAAWWLCDPHWGRIRRWRLGALAAGGALPGALFLLWFQWTTAGHPLTAPQTLWWEFDRIGFGPGIGAEGFHDPASGLHDTWDRLTELLRHLYGWPFYLTLAPAVLPFALGRATRTDWWLLSVAAMLIAAYMLYWNRGMAYGPRYYYEALAPLCLLTARGFVVLATTPPQSPPRPGGRDARQPSPLLAGGMRGGVAALVIALLAFNIIFYLPQQVREFRGYLGMDSRRAEIVRQSGIQRGLVFVREEPRGWQAYASVFWLNSPFLDGDLVYARDRGTEENRRLQGTYSDRPAYLLSPNGIVTLPPSGGPTHRTPTSRSG